MKKLLSVTTLAALLIAQQGSVIEAAAQNLHASLPTESAGVPALTAAAPMSLSATGNTAALQGLMPTAASSLLLELPAAPAPNAAALAAAESPAALSIEAAAAASPSENVESLQPSGAIQAAAPRAGLAARILSRVGRALSLSKATAPETTLAQAFDDGASRENLRDAQVIITQSGKESISTTIGQLDRTLADNPGLKESLNKRGRVRMIVPKTGETGVLTAMDKTGVQAGLAGSGIDRVPEIEKLYIDESPEKGGSAAEVGKLPLGWRRIIGEIAYPFKTLAASFVVPTKHEVVMAVAFKFAPLAASISFLHHTYASHPLAFWTVVGISVGLDVFHGIFGTTWTIFQDKLYKQRGTAYQTVFNLFYGQIWGFLYRLVAWTVLVHVAPPWSAQFGTAVWIQIVFGTFFGTLGWQGTNALYDHGNLNRWQRALILQLRDVKMAISGVLFATNNMFWFWVVFWSQQMVDFSVLYLSSRLVRARPVLYVVDQKTARTPDFQRGYGSLSAPPDAESPLKKAWKNVIASPWMLPIVWPLRKLRGLFRRKK
jgi:hypothetical protein